MDVPSATLGASSAAVAYSEQLEKLNALQLSDRRRDRQFGIAKLAVAACAVIALVFIVHHLWALAPLLGLVLVFVVLLIAHEKVLERVRRRGRAIQF
jgi:O-antigen ligase